MGPLHPLFSFCNWCIWKIHFCFPWYPCSDLIPHGPLFFLFTLTSSLNSFQVTWTYFQLLCISCLPLSNERSLLFYPSGLFFPLPDFLHIWKDCSHTWRKWSSNINWLSLTSLPCRVCSYGILPRRFLKKLKLALLKSVVVNLLAALLSPHPVLNSTLSWWNLQQVLPCLLVSVEQHTIPWEILHCLC